MKRNVICAVAGIMCLGLLVVSMGCQVPGKLVSQQSSSLCPMCQMETRTASISGLTYTKCVCPSCKTVSTVDPLLADSLRAYVGKEIGTTVLVCDHCKAIVGQCPVCRKMSGK